jgi:uncharacterized protein
MAFDDYLIVYFLYFLVQLEDLFLLNIALTVGGRIIYWIALLTHKKKILENVESSEINIDPNTEENAKKPMNKRNFILKEIGILLIGIPFAFGATYILAYSLLLASQLLRTKSEKKHFLILFFGIFFSFIYYAAISYLFISNFTGYPNNPELIAAILAGIVFHILRTNYPKSANRTSHLEFFKKRKWNQLQQGVRVTIMIGVIVAPSLLLVAAYVRVVPKMEEHWVGMGDGIKLRTHVYYPPGWDGSPRPVVMSRTPYNAEGLTGAAYNYVYYNDYIFVGQDLRGTPPNGKGSQGEFRAFRDDYTDGIFTVNWIQNQTWCNGRIASMGGSALAINQMMYHPEQPTGLRAASMYVGTGELYDYMFMIGGCFRLGLGENWLPGVGGTKQINEIMQHPLKDEFYVNGSLAMNDRYKNIDIRGIHVGGWYDMFNQGTLDAFQLYNNASDYAKNHQILVMGPWFHGFTTEHLDITYPDNGMDGLGYAQNAERFIFSEYLDNKTVDWDKQPRVYYYEMGDPDATGSGTNFNLWKTADKWPLDTTYDAWYFHPNGILSNNTPQTGAYNSYIYDPRDPVSNGGGTTLTLKYIGAVDQRRVEYTSNPYNSENKISDTWVAENRSDILKYTSAPLTSDLEVIGRIKTEIYVSSNCTDTDFTAKLIDVFPDGREMWLADGILKARYKNGYSSSNLLSAGNVYQLNIDLWSTAYTFTPGHQIRVSISSSNYNKFGVNPNTGGVINGTHPDKLGVGSYNIANNSVACGVPAQLSCIWLPQLS